MASSSQFGVVVREVSRLFRGGSVTGFSEGQLLDRFVSTRDEAAFEALLARHGPMVLGVCRRVLDDPSDVEDAFQATFLVLVKKAGGLRERDLLANWLYGVALKVARRARGTAARRRAWEKPEGTEAIMPGSGEDDLSELRAVLDDEIARLPDKFRAPVLLCYLQGLTHDQAADRMNCPVGTVRSRLFKAREILRGQLTRRGAAPTTGLLSADRLLGGAPEVPYALIQSTIQAASQLASGQALAAGAVSASTSLLTEGALKAMALKKLMAVATIATTLGVVTVGGSRLAAQQSTSASAASVIQEQDRDEMIESLRKELRKAKAQIAAQSQQIDMLTERLDQLRTSKSVTGNKAGSSANEDMTGPSPNRDPFFAPGQGGFGSGSGSSGMRPGMGTGTATSGAGGMGAGAPEMPGARAGMMGGPGGMMSGKSGMQGGMGGPGMMGGPGGMMGGPGGMMGGAPGKKGVDKRAMSGMMAGGGATGKGMIGRKPEQGFLEGPNNTVITVRGDGEQVVVHHLGSGESRAYKSVNGERLSPIYTAGSTLAIQAYGEEVTQGAVYDFAKKAWNPIRLKESVKDGPLTPIVTGDSAFYKVGRRIYAYSLPAQRWDILTLEDDAPTSVMYGGRKAAFLVDNHLHIFNVESGRWEDIELK